MTTIELRFTSGRFHANPWGRHVNEGVPEWPPSPWRIHRAFVAVWMRRLHDRVQESTVISLLGKLSAPPLFYLPRAILSHTRHYMPWEKKGPDDRTLVFDTFLSVDSYDPVIVHWPGVALDPTEESALSMLLDNLSYFGRSESWCEARLVETLAATPNCQPLQNGATALPDQEVVDVLAPANPFDFRALFVETDYLRLRNIDPMRPPGTAWIQYTRPSDCFEPVKRSGAMTARREVSYVQFAIDSTVPPLMIDVIKIGSLARRSTMAIYGRMNGGAASPVLSGKDSAGNPLKGNKHAHYLPLDEDMDGRVDHLAVWAPAGLSVLEQDALASLRTLNPGTGNPVLNLALQSVGRTEDGRANICSESKIWQSVTPFVLIRHPKLRGNKSGSADSKRVVDSPEDQVTLELTRRGLPAPVSVEPIAGAAIRGRVTPWLAFYRWRRRGTSAGGAYGFVIRFDQPVRGPIALGYGSRFGLGLFFPAGERGRPEDDRAS